MNGKGKDSLDAADEELLWRFGDAEFDERAWTLRLRGVELELEPRPLEILAHLLRHAGEVVTKDELLEAVWGRRTDTISDKVLTNAIGKLRRALGDEQEAMIATVHRRGYRLLAPVIRVVLSSRVRPKLDLKPGDAVPRREQWRLLEALDISARSEVWLAGHAKTRERRVYKFSPDGSRLSSLKREATLSRVLREALGERTDFVRVLEWNFETAPYFLECEYGGEDWVRWAEGRGGLATLPLAERLGLFAQTAGTVGAAHGAGVLHKDLKPSNLLLAARDGGGWQVRVADFGSGRLLEPGQLEALGITRLGFTQTQLISGDSLTGTPLYLAPELLAGDLPSQASDVYALGVLLYQLVVADFRKPLSAGWEEQIEDPLLREDISLAAAGDPARRLDSATTLAQRVATLEQRHAERAAKLRRQADEEAAAIELKRMRQRRPWLVAVLVLLVSGLGLSNYFYRRAEQDARTAWAVSEYFVNGLLQHASPSDAGRGAVTVLEAIRASEPGIEQELAGEPLVAARVLLNVAKSYMSVGEVDDALRAAERALALTQTANYPLPPELLEEALYLAMSAMYRGEAGRAAAERLAALALPRLPDEAFYRGLAAVYRGKLAERDGHWPTVVAEAQKALTEQPSDARAWLLLARARLNLGLKTEASQAEQHLRQAVADDLAAGGPRAQRARSQGYEAALALLEDRQRLGLIPPEQSRLERTRLANEAKQTLGPEHPLSRRLAASTNSGGAAR